MTAPSEHGDQFSQPDQQYDALSEHYFDDMLFDMNSDRQSAHAPASNASGPGIDPNGHLSALDSALALPEDIHPDHVNLINVKEDVDSIRQFRSLSDADSVSPNIKRQRLDPLDGNAIAHHQFGLTPSQNFDNNFNTPSTTTPGPNTPSIAESPLTNQGTPLANDGTPGTRHTRNNSGEIRDNARSATAQHPATAQHLATSVPPGTRRSVSDLQVGGNSHNGAGLEIKKMTEVKSRACDVCRRRKIACYYLNSESAKCFRCQMENIECTFNSPTRAVNSQSNSSGTPNVPIPQRAGAKQPYVAGLVGPVEDYSQLPGRSLLKKTLSLQHPRSSFAIGQHGLWDQRVLQSIQLDKSNQARVSQNLALRKVGPDSWFMIRNEAGHNDWIRECDLIERTVYPYGRALVNSFFMFFHREYPILHEKIFVEKYLRTYRELMPALLGAVYLLGMRWWSHNSELSTVSKPDNIIPTLYDITLTNFFKASGGSSLSLIQAGLLLLQCSYSDTRHLSICSVINAAAFRLALNRNCLHWKLPRWEINLRIRLSWATYTQCTWICLFDSIPPLIHDSNWYLSPFGSEVFDSGSNEPLHNGALFIQMNKLSLIVHDMHNLLSSKLLLMYSSEISATQTTLNNANVNVNNELGNSSKIRKGSVASASSPDSVGSGSNNFGRNSSETTAEDILELIKPIQLRLHEWYANVPSALLDLQGERPKGNFSLRIAYMSAEVILHRFLIRVSCSDHSRLSSEMTSLLRSTARERLDAAFDLIRSLRPQHLQQFWYFTSSFQIAVIGVFAALMYTTSEHETEAEYYRTLLRNYINQLQVYSDSDVMGAALRTLRSSIAGVPGIDI